jgi:hypothetical protein
VGYCALFDSVKKDRTFQKFQLIQANFVQDCGSQTPATHASLSSTALSSSLFVFFSLSLL